jgi:hypothetical protein
MENAHMSTNFTLGLDQRPSEIFRGMDKNSTLVCSILQSELGFPPLVRATPDSIAWTTKKPGIIATVRYCSEDLVAAFEQLSGIAGRLFVSLRVDKAVTLSSSLTGIFETAHGILARTEWDAAFCYEFDHVILRRIRGETFIEDIPDHILRGDVEGLLRQLDPSGQARRGFRQAQR